MTSVKHEGVLVEPGQIYEAVEPGRYLQVGGQQVLSPDSEVTVEPVRSYRLQVLQVDNMTGRFDYESISEHPLVGTKVKRRAGAKLADLMAEIRGGHLRRI